MFVRKKNHHMGYSMVIAGGFFAIIMTGAILLTLPISSKAGTFTPFVDCLFTATSASCVTGLIPFDTATHWTIFGQIVIISMIQIGGLGFMTISMIFMFLFRRKVGLRTRTLLKESANVMYIGGVVRLAKMILRRTLIFEGIGAILLASQFIPDIGWKMGIYYGIFHSISAFCNAGFDLMGIYFGPSSSIVHYQTNPVVCLTICALIVIGGLGFLVWDDITRNRFRFKKFRLHTKVVLTATAILIVAGAALFFVLEYNNTFAGKTVAEKALMAVFQSVTPRTAGFNSVDQGSLTEGSKMLTMFLMFVGGSSGSTAGGIKTTTMVLIILMVLSIISNERHAHIFGRRIDTDTTKRAATIFALNASLITLGTFLICCTSNFSLEDVVFEAFSAMGTVGLTVGVSGACNAFAKIILTLLMYFGRVGSLSFALIFTEKKTSRELEYPEEALMIG